MLEVLQRPGSFNPKCSGAPRSLKAVELLWNLESSPHCLSVQHSECTNFWEFSTTRREAHSKKISINCAKGLNLCPAVLFVLASVFCFTRSQEVPFLSYEDTIILPQTEHIQIWPKLLQVHFGRFQPHSDSGLIAPEWPGLPKDDRKFPDRVPQKTKYKEEWKQSSLCSCAEQD